MTSEQIALVKRLCAGLSLFTHEQEALDALLRELEGLREEVECDGGSKLARILELEAALKENDSNVYETERDLISEKDKRRAAEASLSVIVKALVAAPAPGPQSLKWGLAYADWWADVRCAALELEGDRSET